MGARQRGLQPDAVGITLNLAECYRDLAWYLPNLIGNLHARQEWELFRPFAVGDAMKLEEPDDAYDTVLSIRVIINLGAWELQLKGLQECVRVLRP